ncbi:MAG: GIY-YIG nuclease family protein, partial [Desulfobacteraceae bacterium]
SLNHLGYLLSKRLFLGKPLYNRNSRWFFYFYLMINARSGYYVYVIRSLKDGQLYTGSSGDLKKRVEEHNRGQIQGTKHRAHFELVYYEACQSKYDSFRREKYLKTTYGKRYLKNRLKDYLACYSTGRGKK